LRRSRRADSPSPSVLRVYGLCRLRLGAVDEAVDLLGRAYRLAPTDAWGQLHYGIGLHAVARYDEAAELFRACQNLLPADPAPSLNLASALLEMGDAKAAIRVARKATLRGGTMAQTHDTLGLAYLAAGYADRAADGFRMATRLAPQFADAWQQANSRHSRGGERRDVCAEHGFAKGRRCPRTCRHAAPSTTASAGWIGTARSTGSTTHSTLRISGFPGIRPSGRAVSSRALVGFMHYDLGYIDLEQKTLQPIDNPFGPRLLPMS
jgi:tetratricopeptide (TPR) repeat protein